MKEDLSCLRCGQIMNYISRERIRLGRPYSIIDELTGLLSGSTEVEIYTCPGCGKLEFYLADITDAEEDGGEDEYSEGDIPQVRCPSCGKYHDFDYPKCPYCKHDYNS